jgi:hypothetical protein
VVTKSKQTFFLRIRRDILIEDLLLHRLVSVFEKLSGQEIEMEKLKSMKPLHRLPKVRKSKQVK